MPDLTRSTDTPNKWEVGDISGRLRDEVVAAARALRGTLSSDADYWTAWRRLGAAIDVLDKENDDARPS